MDWIDNIKCWTDGGHQVLDRWWTSSVGQMVDIKCWTDGGHQVLDRWWTSSVGLKLSFNNLRLQQSEFRL